MKIKAGEVNQILTNKDKFLKIEKLIEIINNYIREKYIEKMFEDHYLYDDLMARRSFDYRVKDRNNQFKSYVTSYVDYNKSKAIEIIEKYGSELNKDYSKLIKLIRNSSKNQISGSEIICFLDFYFVLNDKEKEKFTNANIINLINKFNFLKSKNNNNLLLENEFDDLFKFVDNLIKNKEIDIENSFWDNYEKIKNSEITSDKYFLNLSNHKKSNQYNLQSNQQVQQSSGLFKIYGELSKNKINSDEYLNSQNKKQENQNQDLVYQNDTIKEMKNFINMFEDYYKLQIKDVNDSLKILHDNIETFKISVDNPVDSEFSNLYITYLELKEQFDNFNDKLFFENRFENLEKKVNKNDLNDPLLNYYINKQNNNLDQNDNLNQNDNKFQYNNNFNPLEKLDDQYDQFNNNNINYKNIDNKKNEDYTKEVFEIFNSNEYNNLPKMNIFLVIFYYIRFLGSKERIFVYMYSKFLKEVQGIINNQNNNDIKTATRLVLRKIRELQKNISPFKSNKDVQKTIDKSKNDYANQIIKKFSKQ